MQEPKRRPAMKRILIIDDDMHIGNMLEETLSKEGYHVLRAYSGTEAVKRCLTGFCAR